MSDKIVVAYDGTNSRDTVRLRGAFDTSIDIKCIETGETLFKGLKNKVIISGSGLVARKLFDIATPEITPTYNQVLGVIDPAGGELTHELDWHTDATQDDPKVLLFCVGLDGCGTENSQVYPVDYKKWIPPESLIPLRYQLPSNDLSSALRESYFGRTDVGGQYIAYYFKRFDTDPVFIQQYVDGTPIDENVFTSTKKDLAESYVEIILRITKEDVRDYFVATTGIDEARINTISLCSAYPIEMDGTLYFKDIRPVTKLNIPNESLMDVTKGIEVIYHVYM